MPKTLYDPQRQAPKGWKVPNMLYFRLITQAKRTGDQGLIDQVHALKDLSRSEIVCVLEAVSQAAKGRIDPALLNLQQILKEERK